MDDNLFLVTLVASLAAAGVGALIASFLRQSLVLGYIAAGLAIGPHTPGFVADADAVEQLADVGIVFLMFAIGVQLSFSELLRVGPVALAGGNLQVLLTIGAGYGLGYLLGWGHLESLFFGAFISNSSSTVLSKVLSERGELDSLPGKISLAWSTVQDFGTVVLVVVLGTLADGSGTNLGLEVIRAVGLAILFLGGVVPAGLWLLPRFFERVAAIGNTEVFVLSTAGVALGIAFLASVFGISVALGAFVAGILVGRSDVSHEVLGQMSPLRDLFAGLFFVSVGMLIDPGVVAREWPIVLTTAVLIIVFKGLLTGGIVLAFGYRAKTALLSGAILAQSAEFSFLLARLGTDLDAVSSGLFGAMLAGAAVSIVLAPATLLLAQPIGAFVEDRLPLPAQAELPAARARQLHGHVVICGYGRVGRVVHDVLEQQGIRSVVIEQDAGVVAELRQRGVLALQGSASNDVLLERAGVRDARILVIAIPEPMSVRRIVDSARSTNPGLDIVVRTHSVAERNFLQSRGANEAVLGELELALELSRHALLEFGTDDSDAERTLRRFRQSAGGRGRLERSERELRGPRPHQ